MKTIGYQILRLTNIKIIVLATLIFSWSNNSYASVKYHVKKSTSGKCHDTNSRYYKRIKNFESFSTIEECQLSNGDSTQKKKYNRKLFNHWVDSDKDCQDSRTETLHKFNLSTNADKSACKIHRGKWYLPYTGQYTANPSDIDIDHIVTLKFAFEHGADKWSSEKKELFANDPQNLLPVKASANRSKGAKSIKEWLPPLETYRCQYIVRFLTVLKKYKLVITEEERKEFKNIKDTNCN